MLRLWQSQARLNIRISPKESLLHDLCGLCPSPRQQFSTILVETQLAH